MLNWKKSCQPTRITEYFQELINGLSLGSLQMLAMELLRRQPALFADLVNGDLTNVDVNGDPPPPAIDQPDWCKYGLCKQMPTQPENKCCTRSRRPCITTTPLFHQLVLDAVLDIAMRYREDLVMEHPRNHENFRHTAYRQYVLLAAWQTWSREQTSCSKLLCKCNQRYISCSK